MIQKVLRVCLGLVLFGSAFAFASPAGAGPGATGSGSWVSSPSSSPPDAMTSTGSSSSPSGPADSGTGETKESKETRVDYVPYVIGATAVVDLVAAFFFWRKRRISHPANPD